MATVDDFAALAALAREMFEGAAQCTLGVERKVLDLQHRDYQLCLLGERPDTDPDAFQGGVVVLALPREQLQHFDLPEGPQATAPRLHLLPLPAAEGIARQALKSARLAALDHARAKTTDQLLEIGLSLNSERDPSRLLEQILSRARRITGADAGSIYVCEEQGRSLRFKWAQNASRPSLDFSEFSLPITETSVVGACALSAEAIVLGDMYREEGRRQGDRSFSHDRSFDQRIGYETHSMMSVPMVAPGGEILGVIQLINARRERSRAIEGPPLVEPEDFAREVVPFDEGDARIALSLAAQAAVALENARLYAEIQNIFDGFVHAAVKAIEQRDPTTSGHSQRVADLCVAMGRALNRVKSGPLAGNHLDTDALRELEYAALLHDFGKVGVREEVLVKAKKLYPHQLAAIRSRLTYAASLAHLDVLEEVISAARLGAPLPSPDELAERVSASREELSEILRLVETANEPSVLAEERSQQLDQLRGRCRDTPSGPPLELLTGEEIEALLVQRGSLTAAERLEIQSHVTHTYNFLVQIPWGRDLRRIPEIAGKHHEYLDGSGYPSRQAADAIPLQTRVMTVSDIFDALTASDRPYKKAVPLDRALDILHFEAKAGKVDPEVLQLFIETRTYEVIGIDA